MDTLSSSVPTFKLPNIHAKPNEYHHLLKNHHVLQPHLVSSGSRPRGSVVAYKSTTSFPSLKNFNTPPLVSSPRASSPLKQSPGAEFHRKAASGYAVALLEMARQNNVLDEVRRDVTKLSKWLRNKQLSGVIADPCMEVNEKGDVLKEVVKRGMLHKHVVKLVNLLVRKAKVEIVSEVLVEFERIYDELSAPATAQVLLVSSGMKLEKDQILGIAERVQRISGAVNVKYSSRHSSTSEVANMSPPAASASYYSQDTEDLYTGHAHERESMQSERQISVDPISVKEPEKSNLQSFLSAKSSKYLSCSLPTSPCGLKQPHKKKSKDHQGFERQESVALSNLEKLQEIHLRRSKSCREGRSCQPSIDFDLWSNKTSDRELSYDAERRTGSEGESKVIQGKGGKERKSYEEKFKCGAMCLFIPGFGKGKVVRAKYEQEIEQEHEHEQYMYSGKRSYLDSGKRSMEVVSQKVSMEKFDCGSWRSSAVANLEEDGDNTSTMFFDLPVEMIRCSTVNDTESIVTAAFLFDNKDRNIKGVLKNSSSRGQSRSSTESSTASRHVRFSTSSPSLSPTSPPTCVTPRLRNARDEFTAFLEAQSG